MGGASGGRGQGAAVPVPSALLPSCPTRLLDAKDICPVAAPPMLLALPLSCPHSKNPGASHVAAATKFWVCEHRNGCSYIFVRCAEFLQLIRDNYSGWANFCDFIPTLYQTDLCRYSQACSQGACPLSLFFAPPPKKKSNQHHLTAIILR